jgi:betaine-aldehyde dehydrogenase
MEEIMTVLTLNRVDNAGNYIGGSWQSSGSHHRLPSINPATGEVLGYYDPGTVGQLDEALDAARTAFDRTPWATSPRLRADVLLQFAANLAAEQQHLATLNSYENGKSYRQSLREVGTAISETKYYAGLARLMSGRMGEVAPGQYSLIVREPVGVAAIIVPWNAPISLLIRSLVAALAAGCTAVVKPAPQTPLINAAVLSHLFSIKELSAGVVNSINDGGIDVSRHLVKSDKVDVVSFTGSTEIGKSIMAAAAPTLKRVSLELGGKTPAIVFNDADIDRAVSELAGAALVNCGQQCVAASRYLVHRPVVEQFSNAMSNRLRNVAVGLGYDTDSEVGSIIDRANRDRLLTWLDRVKAFGEVVVQGKTLQERHPEGAFLTPSMVLVNDASAEIVQTELFGPIITLEPFDDEEEALSKAHATSYGLAASVFTNDINRGMRMARCLRAGTIWMNVHGQLIAEAEMEGHRESGIGRLHGVDALGEFQQTKHIFLPFQIA